MGFLRRLTPIVALSALLLCGCRHDIMVFLEEQEEVGSSRTDEIEGFYLLNQGNMGANKASLDYYSYSDALYRRNIYATANPDVAMELGDVANDMGIYGSRLWVVVNCSNKVEVLDSRSTRRIGQIDIPNCRFVAFADGCAYVTSYAGPVEIDEDYAQRGYVARIDTATMQITGRVTVGYQPDGIAVSGGKIYVANSGGYRVPNYENTLSVIDLATFQEEKRVEIAINLSKVVADRRGHIWVASRGDYYENPSRLYCYDPTEDRVIAVFDKPVSDLWLDGDNLYTVAASWNFETGRNEKAFCVFSTETLQQTCSNFVSDGSEEAISVPYSVAVNPVSKEIMVTDARTYVNPGYIYCYSPAGVLLWKERTGDVPGRITFLPRSSASVGRAASERP